MPDSTTQPDTESGPDTNTELDTDRRRWIHRPRHGLLTPVLVLAPALLLAIGATTSCSRDSGASRTPASAAEAARTTMTVPAATEIPLDADGSAFYADPPETTAMAPGTLLRYQRVAPTVFRVMYVSGDQLDRPVATTGYVKVPAAPPPETGWPVLSWAHGTTGAADRCAPSKAMSPGSVADALTSDGVAVLATDYVGLGGPGLHPYLDGPSEGRAVLDIVAAAGRLPGVELGNDLVVWGHSQGGHAALFARQLVSSRLGGVRLRGTVAFAPPAYIAPSMSVTLSGAYFKAFGIMALAGIADAHPEAELERVLTPEAAALARSTVDTGCSAEINAAFAPMKGASVLSGDPVTTEPWASDLAADEPATSRGTGPLLLVHAADDTTVPASMSAAIKERTCARHEPTTRWEYPSGGHSGIVGIEPMSAARAWTMDRFAGNAAVGGCGVADRPPT